ncbi:S-adenosyl-L-methionine-dependent methyltransferase, partial [Polyplosphaeria fusca]
MAPTATVSRIVELAAIISKHTALIEDHLVDNNHPSPSFEHSGTASLPRAVSSSQDAIIDATAELGDLMLPPRNLLFRYGAHNNLVCLQAIVRCNIAHIVPLHESGIPYSEIAMQTNLNEQVLRRLIRHAITMRVFSETKTGHVVHTACSRALRKREMYGWMSTGANELWPAATRIVDALMQWPASGEAAETGFALANSTSKSIYDVLAEEPVRGTNFALTMQAFSETPEMSLDHLSSHTIWRYCSSVVDVGGSTGKAAVALAEAHPSLHITVQDLPSVISGAEDGIPQHLKNRIDLLGYDFLAVDAVQPIYGADVYLLRWILHNWSDKYAVQILRSLTPALKQGAKVLVMEVIMPEPRKIPLWREKDLRAMDVDMMALFNSKERSLEEWKELFVTADARFDLSNEVQPEGSALGIMEVTW